MTNGSFETDAIPGGVGYTGTFTGWTVSGGTLRNGNALQAFYHTASNGAVPNGVQVAGCQGAGSFSQAIGGLYNGLSCTPSFYICKRADGGSNGDITLTVKLGTQTLYGPTVVNWTTFTAINIATFNYNSSWGNTLTFTVSDPVSDATLLLDYVRFMTPTTYTIAGNAGIAGATVTPSPSAATAGAVTADASGNYTLTVNYGWSGAVTPSITGYSFTPASRSYTSVAANQTAQNYTATLNTYTISGNAGTAGVTLTPVPSAGTGGAVTADSSGNYSLTVNYGWSGAVTPSKTGYTFSASSRSYSAVAANQTSQGYTAIINTYTISGNAGTAGATLTPAPSAGTGGAVTADGSGNYSLTVNYGWSGAVTPSKTGYTFAASSRSYSAVAANQTSQNYTATLNTYTISGNAGTAGATLTPAPSAGTSGAATADASGNYSVTVNYGWSGAITPTKAGYTFTPANRSYTTVVANAASQDYTALQLQTITFGALDAATYGDAPLTLTATASSGLAVSYTSSDSAIASVSGDTVTILKAGAVDITAHQAGNSSYAAAADVTRSLTINRRAITVTADAVSKTYGDTDPALTAQITEGSLVGSDALSGALSRNPGENANTYAILQGTLTAGTNYDITFVSRDLTIDTLPITVTADAVSKTYGDADPALTAQITEGSLIGSDALSGALSRNPGENVGAYAILKGALTAGGNYDMTFISRDLTITAKALTVSGITVDDKAYDGDTDAVISAATLDGVVGTDDVALSAPMAGTFTGKDVGNAISVTANLTLTGDSIDNYTLTPPTGLTADITAAVLTATIINNPTKAVDGNATAILDPDNNYHLEGLAPGESIRINKTSGVYAGTTAQVWEITVTLDNPATDFTAGSGTLLSNYVLPTEARGNGVITVKMIPEITTLPVPKAITFGENLDAALPWVTAGVAKVGETVVAGAFTFTDGTIVPADAGVYSASITFTPNNLGSYTTASANVDVTVNKATPVVTTPPTASSIITGQALSAAVLSGDVVDVAGAWAFTDPDTVPTVSGQYSVTFTPEDADNYNTVTAMVLVTVLSDELVVLADGDTEVTANPGGTVTFKVLAQGVENPNAVVYEWKKENAAKALEPVPGGDSNTLTLTDITEANAGTYQCFVSEGEDSAVSPIFTLTVTSGVPVAGLAGLLALSSMIGYGASRRLRKRG